MLARLVESIADSFHHRFGWPARHGDKPDEYQERFDETRGAAHRILGSRRAEGHYRGHPDGVQPGGKSRRV